MCPKKHASSRRHSTEPSNPPRGSAITSRGTIVSRWLCIFLITLRFGSRIQHCCKTISFNKLLCVPVLSSRCVFRFRVCNPDLDSGGIYGGQCSGWSHDSLVQGADQGSVAGMVCGVGWLAARRVRFHHLPVDHG